VGPLHRRTLGVNVGGAEVIDGTQIYGGGGGAKPHTLY